MLHHMDGQLLKNDRMMFTPDLVSLRAKSDGMNRADPELFCFPYLFSFGFECSMYPFVQMCIISHAIRSAFQTTSPF